MNESDAYDSNKTQVTAPHSYLFNNLIKKKKKTHKPELCLNQTFFLLISEVLLLKTHCYALFLQWSQCVNQLGIKYKTHLLPQRTQSL